MARPEPNICSQKWGKAWPGARTSNWIVSVAGWGFSGAGCCADAQTANEASRDQASNVRFIRWSLTERWRAITEGSGCHKYQRRPIFSGLRVIQMRLRQAGCHSLLTGAAQRKALNIGPSRGYH